MDRIQYIQVWATSLVVSLIPKLKIPNFPCTCVYVLVAFLYNWLRLSIWLHVLENQILPYTFTVSAIIVLLLFFVYCCFNHRAVY